MKQFFIGLVVLLVITFISAIDSMPTDVILWAAVVSVMGYVFWRIIEWNRSCTPPSQTRRVLTTIERTHYTLPKQRRRTRSR